MAKRSTPMRGNGVDQVSLNLQLFNSMSTTPHSYLVLVDEVVAGEVLLGLQRHQLVVVADAHTGRGSLLLVYTAHRSWISQ